MSDIVRHLKDHAAGIRRLNPVNAFKAADEIERLRKEREKLRAALEECEAMLTTVILWVEDDMTGLPSEDCEKFHQRKDDLRQALKDTPLD